jgi:hypothetical protein
MAPFTNMSASSRPIATAVRSNNVNGGEKV